MTSTPKSRFKPLLVLALCFLANTAIAGDSGPAIFTTEGHSYIGQYSMADATLSVAIEGMKYQGNFSQTASSQVLVSSTATGAGPWGKAFLFASSAKVMQCQLDSGFPKLRGKCRNADGRDFRLEAEQYS
ncbi:MAG: hypothetical protein H7228_11145 [Polaromonas sp.]|nr:hypothetical protein [Polaromonas sp.]